MPEIDSWGEGDCANNSGDGFGGKDDSDGYGYGINGGGVLDKHRHCGDGKGDGNWYHGDTVEGA